jgi:hypothetical protein
MRTTGTKGIFSYTCLELRGRGSWTLDVSIQERSAVVTYFCSVALLKLMLVLSRVRCYVGAMRYAVCSLVQEGQALARGCCIAETLTAQSFF